MNGLSLLALIGVALVITVAYLYGRLLGRRESVAPVMQRLAPATPATPTAPAASSEVARLHAKLTRREAEAYQLEAFAVERRALLRETGRLRGEVARYRQVVVDLEDNAPPPILSDRGMPDDLKLIVGIGPALERMLQQLGVTTYRQIARWSEHDIDEMDARLPEFPGRVRRDAWVTQARQLHLNKYGDRP